MLLSCFIFYTLFQTIYALPYLNYINLTIYRNDLPIGLVFADNINNEKNATEILIENQELPIIFKGTFTNLTSLRELRIKSNNLTKIEQGAFENIPQIKIIDLNFNNIKKLTFGVFNGLHVKKLCFRGNGIIHIDYNTFHDLPYLEFLDLSHNNLVYLAKSMFVNTQNINHLNLEYNQLGELPAYYFNEAWTNVLMPYQDSTINLSHNRLSYLHSLTFKGVTSLKNIFLEDNLLEFLDDNLFDDLTYVENINLQGNKLESLNETFLLKLLFAGAKNIDLSINNFDGNTLIMLHGLIRNASKMYPDTEILL